MADKPVPIFGSAYSSTTALGEPMPVRCGYLKCGILFMTYEPRRKYCCTKHKNAESARLKRQREDLNGPLQAAIAPMTAAAADMAQREQQARVQIEHMQTPEGAKEAFDQAVATALEWVVEGKNVLGPFTLDHIKDDKVRRAVNNRLAQMNAGDSATPLIVDERTSAIHEALGLGKNTEELQATPIADAPAIDYKERPKTDEEKAKEL